MALHSTVTFTSVTITLSRLGPFILAYQIIIISTSQLWRPTPSSQWPVTTLQ